MKLRAMARLSAVIALLLSQGVIGSGTDDIVFTPIGDAFLQIGQIANGYYKAPGDPSPTQITNMWQQQAYAHIGYDALIQKRLDINISVGGSMVYSSPQILKDPATAQSQMQFLINSAYASYPFIQNSSLFSLTVQGGYFPYKYNPDVRNLGEYLFRANAYPLLVYSSFDYPRVRLLGARIGMQAFDSLVTNDVLLHSEVVGVPVQDWSIADIFNVHLFKMLDIGGGVDFTHLFSVYPGPYNSSLNGWYNYYYTMDSANSSNYIERIITKNPNGTNDTTWADTLNWRSIKLMGRFAFDPKNALKSLVDCKIFGKDDFKLYGEADIIGVENYPSSNAALNELDNRPMRTIYSVGFNIPTFKLLDVVNVEVEYNADTTSAFSDQNLMDPSLGGPTLFPYLLNGGLVRSPWRWSIYAKKSVCNDHVSFIAQVARDHTKINFNYWDPTYMSFMETLPTSSDWWWSFKTEVKF